MHSTMEATTRHHHRRKFTRFHRDRYHNHLRCGRRGGLWPVKLICT